VGHATSAPTVQGCRGSKGVRCKGCPHTLCIWRPLHLGVFGYRIPPLRRYSWFVAQCCMNSVHSSYCPCPYYYTISTTSVLTPLDVKFSCLPCEGFFRVLRLWESEGTIQLLEFLDTCHSWMLQQWIKHVLSCPTTPLSPHRTHKSATGTMEVTNIP
jgi:hypothetical protein